jgi:UDP-N-acetyl-D-mannosaminuronic acid transferase (WecB/TagA/CpsF family)
MPTSRAGARGGLVHRYPSVFISAFESPASSFGLRYGSFQFLKTHTILGIRFFGGTSREAVEEISRTGGLLVAPAAPSMINLSRDEEYRRALLASDIAIADSGFMVLFWKFFVGERVPRISGLEHVKRLLEHESVRQPGAVLWVVPTESSREKLLAFLSGERARPRAPVAAPRRHGLSSAIPAEPTATELSERSGEESSQRRGAVAGTRGRVRSPDIYIAPQYRCPVEDEALLALVRRDRPKHIVIAVGGGTQDKVGLYLLEKLDYRPAIHCIGAAIGFLTGDQVRIPHWADKYYVGWFFRSLAQPRVFIPRFWSVRRLPWLIWKYRDRLPPLA